MRNNGLGAKREQKQLIAKPVIRVFIMASMVFVILISVTIKAFKLQVVNRDIAIAHAKRQHHTSLKLLPKRGRILDANLKVLAMNVEAGSIYMRPKVISNPDEFSNRVSKILGVSATEIKKKFLLQRPFIWLKRLAEPEVLKKVEEEKIEGLGVVKESKRVYPSLYLAGQVLGFTDIDQRGIEGIEYAYESSLAGTPEEIVVKRDGKGREIITIPEGQDDDTRGKDIVLTIDSQIQYIVESELKAGVESAKADRGIALMMDPETGAILAMATYPFFDPNNVSNYKESTRRNLPVWFTFEPGSTMKIFLVAAALEEGKINPQSKFNCMNGRRRIGKNIIKDVKPYGELNVGEIIKVSSNICSSLIAEQLGKELFYEYLKKFGFGEQTGIDLPGEGSGKVADYKLWGQIELATQSFGQGLSVTPLQLARALSAIANGGFLMKPFVVQRITGPTGADYREIKPKVIRRVVSYDTAKIATEMLEGVVSEGGSGQRAFSQGYRIAGKTGTAQVPNQETGGYDDNHYVASFMGFAPADNPKIVLVVVVDNPKTSPYGGVVAAPIFKAIAEKTLYHMGVPPTKAFAETKIMPNLKGLSARESLKWAEELGVDIQLKGSGYVVSQKPEPGEKIKEGTVCMVELRQNL